MVSYLTVSLAQNELPKEFMNPNQTQTQSSSLPAWSSSSYQHGIVSTNSHNSQNNHNHNNHQNTNSSSSDRGLEETEVEIQLTPRSCSACEMQGILPEELVYLPLSNFKKRNILPEQALMRYHHYENRRIGMYDMLLHEERLMYTHRYYFVVIVCRVNETRSNLTNHLQNFSRSILCVYHNPVIMPPPLQKS